MTKRKKPSKRMLLPTEYEVRDLHWAVGVNCQCGYQLDLFIRNIPEEMKCKNCGRKYEVALRVYQINI